MIYDRKGEQYEYDGINYVVGGRVQANEASAYHGLYGVITEIRTDGDRETDKMDLNHTEEILRMMKNNALGPNGTFEFDCDRCGKCCREREDILLSPCDLFRIAKHLGITPEAVVDTYCDKYIGENSRIPIIRLRPKEYRHTCPFLSKEGCAIHAAKPNVCAIFPLGRGIAYGTEEMLYFTQPITCGNKGKYHTVKDWIESFGRPVQDTDAIAWMKVMGALGLIMINHEKSMSDLKKVLFWQAVYQYCYIGYDIHRDFSEQFTANVDALKRHLENIGIKLEV